MTEREKTGFILMIFTAPVLWMPASDDPKALFALMVFLVGAVLVFLPDKKK